MNESNNTLEMAKLLGFEEVMGEVDLTTPELATRVGAKVGETEPCDPPEPEIEPLDNARLFGFDTRPAGIDFRNPAVASQVGAKIGTEPP